MKLDELGGIPCMEPPCEIHWKWNEREVKIGATWSLPALPGSTLNSWMRGEHRTVGHGDWTVDTGVSLLSLCRLRSNDHQWFQSRNAMLQHWSVDLGITLMIFPRSQRHRLKMNLRFAKFEAQKMRCWNLQTGFRRASFGFWKIQLCYNCYLQSIQNKLWTWSTQVHSWPFLHEECQEHLDPRTVPRSPSGEGFHPLELD